MTGVATVSDSSKKRKLPTAESDTPKKKKFNNKDYDKNDRVRKFQQTWKIPHPWVVHEPDKDDDDKPGVMFCSTCRAYPHLADQTSSLVKGCSTMRKTMLDKHSTSVAHIKATEKKNDAMTKEELTLRAKNSPIVKAAKRCVEIGINILKVMFNNVYALAKKDFSMSISEQNLTETAEIIKNSRFMSVLADGSTDASMTEQYTVLVRSVNDGIPKTRLASIVAIDHANAAGVYDAIEEGLNRVLPDQHPKIVSVNIDGAAVMLGCNNSVSTLMREKNKSAIPVHCVAHKLELGVLDAVKSVDYLAKFEETVKGIFLFYSKSPKRRRELQSMAELFETDLLKYGDVKGVRWVASKSKALKAIENNLPATLGHLEHAASSKKAEESGKARKLFNEMKSVRFVKYMYLMMDYLAAITATSKKFQTNNLLITDVAPIISDLSGELLLLIEEPGEHSKTFVDNFDTESNELKHGGHVLVLTGNNPQMYSEDSNKTKLLEASIEHLERRFNNFEHKPLKNFQVFNIQNWPSEQKELLKYGREEIRGLDHFSEELTDDKKTSIMREWTTLKNQLKNKKSGTNIFTLYSELLQTMPDDIANILVLVQIMMTISPSTAECERQFSAMNLIKSSLRSHMNQDTLEALLGVHADGPPLAKFDPLPAIHHWMSCGPGTRHLAGHKIPTKTVAVSESDDEKDDDTSRDP